MAVNSSEKKQENEEAAALRTGEEEDEEEALSLCDLPVNANNIEDQKATIKADSSSHHQEEFDFLLWGGQFFQESEMCVADEVFFQGQIRPLCCKSISSDASTGRFNRSESSKSEPVTTAEFRSSSSSSSSRSSSISSSTSTTNSIVTITNPEIPKPTIRNHHHHLRFHTHPSPKPQLKASSNSSSRQVSLNGHHHHLNRKSSTWDFFRLGVAPAPEIGLQDLKIRCTNNNKNKAHSVSRRNSNSSNSSNNSSNHGLRQIVRGCKCSVETVPLDVMITKSTKKTESTTTNHAMKEKSKQKQRKKAMSRHRTFEWIKELSQHHEEEEALLLNS